MKNLRWIFYFLIFCESAFAQQPNHSLPHSCFKDITLQVDTNTFSLSKDIISMNGEKKFSFLYQKDDAVCELKIYPHANENIKSLTLIPSADFDILDSLYKLGDYYRLKVKFTNLTKSQFVNFIFSIEEYNGKEIPCEIILQPYHQTTVNFYPKDDELYIGEEKVFELVTNNINNIRPNPTFTEGKDINYRTEIVNGQLRLYLLPSKTGDIDAAIELQTINPQIDEKKNIKYKLAPIKRRFKVKGSRLAFLNTDLKDVTLEDKTQHEGVLIQLDFTRLLQLQRTYRIENQEAPGGALVAEIFTKSFLSNGKILCVLRPYAFHKLTEGYLYIKNGDVGECITNFTITPKTTINSISVLHAGGKRDLNILPGEIVEVRMEGLSLNKADLKFEALSNIASDSVIKTETVQTFKLQAPINITDREIDIYNRNEKTGYTIHLAEQQLPHQFDFVNINYGNGSIPINTLGQTNLYDRTIKDILFSFSPEKIDFNGKLFGKQYMHIDITVSNAKGELIEIKKIENLLICPNEDSPRFAFYNDKLCNKTPISLNSILGRKTYDLDGWSKIEIIFSHDRDKYGGDGFTKKIEIILQRHYKFDTDVSFPGGLLIKRADQTTFNSFGGISLAIMGQFAFYDPQKINRYRPYRIGAGILANNAFNFSANAENRDVGLVIIGSLYPTRKDVKLSFPLHAGFGYFLGVQSWFILVGPGISISL